MVFLQRAVYNQARNDSNFINHWYKLVDQYTNAFIQEGFPPDIVSFQAIDIHESVIHLFTHDPHHNTLSITLNCTNEKQVVLSYTGYYNINMNLHIPMVGQIVLFDEWIAETKKDHDDEYDVLTHAFALESGQPLRIEGGAFNWTEID